ncbi:hypothetical protein WISP_01365 [Willisornis vidua]|uniref:Ig-like domain-containing protein n=1 Tax=Willisornis vidua TaxID=1566151 RepID=A0ABQ9E0V3_9PASS|nr:hypothetical protein WISP_01365 [Willisornis vidua]
MNTSNAQQGEQVLFHCLIGNQSPNIRIVFCKEGDEVHSLKAQQEQLSYSVPLTVMRGSSGTYTCGYQHKDNKNRVSNSALGTPLNLSVTGERGGTGVQANNTQAPQTPGIVEDLALPPGMSPGR